MSPPINIKATIKYKEGLEPLITKLTQELSEIGFGVLTRINFHEKMKEKVGETIPPLVILGACQPQAALMAYRVNPDVTALMPCNAVVREAGTELYSIELAKPSAILAALPHSEALQRLGHDLDEKFFSVIARLQSLH